MKGHITYRRSSWYIVYSEPQGDSGKSKQRWRGGFQTKSEAEDALGAIQDMLRPRGQRPRSDDEHRRIASLYLAKLAERTETNRGKRGMLVEIAAEVGIPRNTLKRWVHGARQRGFLSSNSSTQGTPVRPRDRSGQ